MGAIGLDPGERVAVFAENAVETVLAHLGGLLAGVSTVPVNFHLTTDELAYILGDSGHEAAVRRARDGRRRAGCGPRRSGSRSWSGGAASRPMASTPWETWLAEASDAEPPTDVAPRPNLMYTSGTTGRPKGVELPPTMFAGGKTDRRARRRASAQSAFARYGTHLVVGPMYHTGPLSGVRLLAAGVPVVVLGRFDAEGLLRAIDTYKTETSVMVPTHFARLLSLPDDVRTRYDVSSMKLGRAHRRGVPGRREASR